jgi:4-hydroxybenzoate polyprenyltransferase
MAFLKLIRVRETAFSLPLAYIGMLMVAETLPSLRTWVFVTTALVSARTLGMCLNRILDKDIDAQNSRTAHRLLPSGAMAVSTVLWYVAGAAVIFVGSAYLLNSLCFYLAFPALLLLLTYSLVKRFSSLSHFHLGLTEACAPIGGALAVDPRFSLPVLLVGCYMIFWIAGFDIIYSCQDREFDRTHRLFSIPVRYGLKNTLVISAALHGAAVAMLILIGFIIGAHSLYFVCLAAVCGFFIRQHTLVSASDLSRLQAAFFNMNRNISFTVLLAFLLNFIFTI